MIYHLLFKKEKETPYIMGVNIEAENMEEALKKFNESHKEEVIVCYKHPLNLLNVDLETN